MGTTYDIRIRSVGCTTEWSEVYTFTTLGVPPVNDEVAGAIELFLNQTCNQPTFSNMNALPVFSDIPEPVGCFGPRSTVWYKFTAPATGMVRVTTGNAQGDLIDTRLTLYSAVDVNDYGTFVPLFCNEDDGNGSSGYLSTLYAAGLTPGATYYLYQYG